MVGMRSIDVSQTLCVMFANNTLLVSIRHSFLVMEGLRSLGMGQNPSGFLGTRKNLE